VASLPSSKKIIRFLEKNGFTKVSQKGSHCKYRKEKYTVIIPHPKKEIPIGTFRSIMRQSRISWDDF
jgi:predicted RNA binding protein YcfA (HicA-like mRNA interferase family)